MLPPTIGLLTERTYLRETGLRIFTKAGTTALTLCKLSPYPTLFEIYFQLS